jgi:methylmalonyl-CoA mutase C-terminal domain/subunit
MYKKLIKVLIAKPGLDGHDRGSKVLTLGLRDAGMETVYTGLRQTPEMVAEAAVKEHADVVGLSCLSGAHNYLFPEVVKELKKKGLDNVLIIGGGNIPKEDIPFLLKNGVDAIFGQGAALKDIAEYIQTHVKKAKQAVKG